MAEQNLPALCAELRALPPMLTTRRVENITRFLEEAAYARAS